MVKGWPEHRYQLGAREQTARTVQGFARLVLARFLVRQSRVVRASISTLEEAEPKYAYNLCVYILQSKQENQVSPHPILCIRRWQTLLVFIRLHWIFRQMQRRLS